MAVSSYSMDLAGRKLTLETGRMAGLAGGAVLVTYGETVVLATGTTSDEPREGIDFFPLSVEFEEKMYAAGKIPGGFIKREGRPTENAILTARLTDRPLRPLFPKDYRNDVQVVVTVLAADQVNDPSILSIIGASAALTISDIPFYGPVAGVRVGLIGGEIVINPTMSEMAYSDLDLVVAGTADAILMVEAGAKEVPEAIILEALEAAHEEIRRVCDLQLELQKAAGKPKREFIAPKVDPEIVQAITNYVGGRLEETIYDPDKATREDSTKELRREVIKHFADTYDGKTISKVFGSLEKETVRRNILEHSRRPDGRTRTQIRPVTCEVGVLPRVHGSALFTRGQTQVLSIATLGTEADEQRTDSIGLDDTKRYMHHYNFPPFSVGETRPMRGPGRRDIGHGALAERGLMAVLPAKPDFPYTVRVVSEVLSSNGSSSMGSTCGSTLALMDAGVPITAPVSGVAMGLITGEDGSYAILSDIQGLEDALGDMDFKVAGTEKGITALQMDIKVAGLTTEVLEEALAQAREGRMWIMGKMLAAIERPRTELSAYAPRITKISINPDRIRDVIGPGGKMIRKIVEETKCTVDVSDDGTVLIGSNSAENAKKAIDWIERLTKDVEAGTIYTGKVTRLMAFGAFVEILPGKEGLVHISELANYRVPRVEDVVNVGDEITVLVTEIDRQGRINLSRRALLDPAEETGPEGGPDGDGPPDGEGGPPRPPRREGGFGDRPPRREGGFGGPRGDRGPREGGPPRDRDGGDRPPRRDGGGYGGSREGGDRPPRREGGFGDRPPRREGGDRPPRREGGYSSGGSSFGGDRPPRREGGDRPPRREGGDRPPRREGGEDRPPREGGPCG
ncbi:MAG: polyribonucleotide nucleotidyltransferase, partial [Chloroflexota bacterium]